MGFSAEWLSLREPADSAARSTELLRRAVQAAGPAPVIVDLGCGSGSTVRAMMPHLPAETRWRLVDNDPDLLEIAAADTGPNAQTVRLDLADLDGLPLDGVTLVTASALLDLVTAEWVRALAARLNVPFYAALSYDGAMSWDPEDPRDMAVTEAFNGHQTGDKGFGAALGPRAVDASAQIFSAEGFDVSRAPSPWRLGPQAAPLQRALLTGIAEAAAEAGEPTATAWGFRRSDLAGEGSCSIGHEDLLVLPKGPGL